MLNSTKTSSQAFLSFVDDKILLRRVASRLDMQFLDLLRKSPPSKKLSESEPARLDSVRRHVPSTVIINLIKRNDAIHDRKGRITQSLALNMLSKILAKLSHSFKRKKHENLFRKLISTTKSIQFLFFKILS
jgi:hypothetical protein